MKLIRLRLENFRQHRDTTVEFRDGMTAIVGVNGSGKSTLLEAITFALFGEQRQTKDSIRFHWAGPRERFRAELTFEFGGRRYVVERGEKSAELRADGNVVAEGLREVKAACERLLRLTHDQFVNSFCAEQKSLEFLKFKDRTTRQNEVARMLGLDRLKQAGELARQQSRVCRNKVELLGEEQHGRDRLEAAVSEADLRSKTERQRHCSLAERMLDSERTAAAARLRSEAATQWLALERKIQEGASQLAQIQGRKQLLQEEIARLEKDAAEFLALAEAEQQYQAARLALEALDAAARTSHAAAAETALRAKRAEEIEVDKRALREAGVTSLAEIDRTPAEARASLEALERSLQEARDSWQNERQAVVQSHADARALRDAARTALLRSERMTVGSACPECGQTIEKNYAELVRERAKALEAAETALAEAEKLVEAGAQTPPALESLEGAIRKAREHSFEADSKARDLRGAWERIETFTASEEAACTHDATDEAPSVYDPAQHAEVQTRVRELLPSHERSVQLRCAPERLAEAGNKAPALLQQLLTLEQASEALRKEQATLGFPSAEAAQTAHEAFREHELAHATLKADLDASARILESVERERETAAKRLEEFREREKRIASLKVDQVHFDAVGREMASLREKLNQQIRPDLESRASDNLLALSGGRYAALELDEQFEATVLDDGVKKAVISGGEEDIVALSLRLALSELIQERQGTPLSLLILDEVFGSLDGERRQLVMERLAGLKGRFDQVLVISHIEEINQVADQCVYLHRDEHSKSTYASDAPLQEAPILML